MSRKKKEEAFARVARKFRDADAPPEPCRRCNGTRQVRSSACSVTCGMGTLPWHSHPCPECC